MSAGIVTERRGRLARVTFDNARRGNCFDRDLLHDLVDALEKAAADGECAVVHLVMAGDHFCGGWDTSSFASLAAADEDAVARSLRESDQALGRIRQLPVPVVAAVQGQVIGFGVGLLAAVHLPIASSEVRLHLPELEYGFAPAGVGYTIARSLPRAHAYALLTGTPAGAQQLLSWGLVSRVVPPDSLEATTHALVAELAAVPGDALRALVEVVESSRETGDPDQAYRASARTIAGRSATGTAP